MSSAKLRKLRALRKQLNEASSPAQLFSAAQRSLNLQNCCFLPGETAQHIMQTQLMKVRINLHLEPRSKHIEQKHAFKLIFISKPAKYTH